MKFDYVVALTGAGISAGSGIPTFEEHPEIKEVLNIRVLEEEPEKVEEALNTMRSCVEGKEPNDAHKALAEYKVPIITMNIDSLHQKAGSKEVIELHGNLKDNNVVLYGQPMNNAGKAWNMINMVTNNARNCLLVVGTSLKTQFANELISDAMMKGYYVKRINENAETEVRKFLESIFEEEDDGVIDEQDNCNSDMPVVFLRRGHKS